MLASIALLLVVVIYRFVLGTAGGGALPNFSPLAAVALCAAVYFPGRLARWLPLGMLLLSDIAINLALHKPFFTLEILPRYLALPLVTMLGVMLRNYSQRTPNRENSVGFLPLLGSATAGWVLFYIITNTGSWLGEPGYAKTFGGWVQALTTGLPGYPSTLWFSRQSLVSDLLFTTLFAACMALQKSPAALKAPQPA